MANITIQQPTIKVNLEHLKKQAHQAVHKALKEGRLKRPLYCPHCNRLIAVIAHHDDYTKPLNIDWRCWRCHRMLESPAHVNVLFSSKNSKDYSHDPSFNAWADYIRWELQSYDNSAITKVNEAYS